MRTLWIIFINFLKLTFAKKVNYLFFFLLPAAGFSLMMLLFGFADSTVLVCGYVNKDKGTLGADLVAFLAQNKKNRIIPIPEAKIEEKVLDGSVALCLKIPEDFTACITVTKPVIQLVSIQGESAAGFLQSALDQYIGNVTRLYRLADGDAALALTMYHAFRKSKYSLELHEVRYNAFRNISGSVSFGLLLFLILLQAAMITGLMLKEKENRTYMRICIAPVRELSYSLGNLLAAFVIIGGQIVCTLFVLVGILRFDLTIPVWPALALLLAFSCAAIGLGIMVTAIVKSPLQATLLMNLIIIPSTYLSGCFWPISFMPEFIRKLAGLFPQSWTMQAIEKLQSGASFASVGFTVPLLLAFALLFIAVYAYRMRHEKG